MKGIIRAMPEKVKHERAAQSTMYPNLKESAELHHQMNHGGIYEIFPLPLYPELSIRIGSIKMRN